MMLQPIRLRRIRSVTDRPALTPLRLDRNATIARRLAIGCLLPAALTPKADYSHRWGHVKAAAGAIAAISCLGSVDTDHAEQMIVDVDKAFHLICLGLAGSTDDPSEVAYIWQQQEELINGLRKRVAERMSLLTADGLDEVEQILAAIAKERAK